MAGFLIFWDKPFHVGEWVTLGEFYGPVGEITMRTTRLQTRDNTWVIIPNESVINKVLVNHSTRGRTRLQVPVGIGYADSIPHARQVILDAFGGMAMILKDPAPQVVVADLGSSSVNLLVFAWIEDANDEKPAFFAVMETVKLILDQAGISMPFAQMDLSLVSVRDEVWEKARELSTRTAGQSTDKLPNGNKTSAQGA
jgi:small conductance mechanosensitive channel